MDIGRIGSLFVHSVETRLGGNAIRLTAEFHTPIDPARLARAFRDLITSTASLRQRLDPDGWTPMRADDVQTAVNEQAELLTTVVDASDAYSEYRPTNVGLPIRLAIIAPCRLVLSLNHAVGNGKAAFAHLEALLRAYDGAERERESVALSPRAARSPRGVHRAAGVTAAAWYLIGFVARAGLGAARTTVDLSRGRMPAPDGGGCAVWTYHLDAEDTGRVLAGAKAAGLTVTGRLCQAMSEVLLGAQPDRSRVCISVPTDVTALAGLSAAAAPGNFTGSLILQVFRSADPASVASQVRRAFRWTTRNVHYWVPWLVGQLTRQEARLAGRFLAQARRPIPARAPFENYSCAVSSVGVITGPMTRRYLTTVSAHTWTQTIMVCAITLDGRMTLEASMPRDLYDPAEVAAVTDMVVARLADRTLGHAAGLRRPLFDDRAG